MNKQKRADLLLVMVTFFWGASYYLTNLCLTDLQPMNLNAFRFLSAFAVLGVVFRKRLRRMRMEKRRRDLEKQYRRRYRDDREE